MKRRKMVTVSFELMYPALLILLLRQVVYCDKSLLDKMDISYRLNDFSLDLYKEINEATNGNILFSPFSIFTAFTMLGIGARGKTKKEISSALKWGKLETLVKNLKPLYEEMSKRNTSGSRLDIANRVWVSDDTKILKPYRHLLSKSFRTKIHKKSFRSSPEGARKSINHWISHRTNKNIKELFPVRSFHSKTKLVLGNAISFKGIWELPFDRKETRSGNFYLSNGKHVKVDYMMTEDKFPAYFDYERGVQLVSLPYDGGAFSMILALPQVTPMNEIETSINSNIIDDWIKKLTARNTNWSSKFLYVPKFTIEQRLPLSKLLQTLSIHDVFHPSKADLSGINGDKNLYCSSAVHKSYIKVDEEGTISSSVTGIGITMLSYPMTIRLERQFLFYIVHRQSKTIIFSGKVVNPTEMESNIPERDIIVENNDFSEQLNNKKSSEDISQTTGGNTRKEASSSIIECSFTLLTFFSSILSIFYLQQFS